MGLECYGHSPVPAYPISGWYSPIRRLLSDLAHLLNIYHKTRDLYELGRIGTLKSLYIIIYTDKAVLRPDAITGNTVKHVENGIERRATLSVPQISAFDRFTLLL